MSEYAEAAKKLISVCNRLEKWFVGERLYETVYASTDDEFEISFRWDYGSKHFEYLTEEKGWKKVINTKYPLLMANLITLIPTLHQKAQARKAEVGEPYLLLHRQEKCIYLICQDSLMTILEKRKLLIIKRSPLMSVRSSGYASKFLLVTLIMNLSRVALVGRYIDSNPAP